MPPPSADPPEEPTRPLPPTTRAPAGPVYEREVAAPVEDPYRTEILLDRLRSLRTALVIVGVIAVAALAVAVYAVLTMEEESDVGGGASRQRVANLEERVDALEAEAATKDDVNQISDGVRALSGRLDQVAKQARSAASSDNSGTDEQRVHRSTSSTRMCRRSPRASRTSTNASVVWRSNSRDPRGRRAASARSTGHAPCSYRLVATGSSVKRGVAMRELRKRRP